ncbi:MAG TPA: SLC13 family permease [Nitrosomonas sp.]|uniref:SLC13 family permease n=1 Tax=Nitrosomonas sp. TaxID=42353 RepID=UPI000E8C86D5|nr:SLC13 family permease [Nitrosomonas sp.]GJL76383.1 MAG: SLC13 family permease [Nitrosomonas sp.]HBV20441.1 SLC13 family permease [Nitrosomonas sp.]HNP25486.1 SLC13 family permease [Nitrosomonas sp.]
MATDQWLIISILLITAVLFLWGHWRHDLVAIGALLACIVTGLVSYSDAFIGFSHPAVITVACILILSAGLQNSGAVDWLTRWMLPIKSGPVLSIVSLTCLAAVLSGFMNNVGALAILIPVALQMASRLDMPPGQILMPLAFGSILGGMTTLIGTPPNLIVSGIRAETTERGYFSMFDFTSVGLAVAVVGVLFISLLGWRLVPARKPASYESFDLSAYLTEARVTADSKAVGMNLREIETVLEAADAQVVGLVRNDVRVTPANLNRKIYTNDILIIEAEAESLANALSSLGLVLEEAKTKATEDTKKSDGAEKPIDTTTKQEKEKKKSNQKTQEEENKTEKPASGEIILTEYVVLPASLLVNRSPQAIELRTRHGVNLLALSRKGSRITTRLRTILFQAGDVLMLQGPPDTIAEFAENTGCVPLAERTLRIPDKRKALLGGIIMMLAIGAIVFGLLPPAIAFMCGVLAVTALQIIPLRSVYQVIDWPVIVLLAALIPVAGAMQATGAADLIARVLLENLAQGHAVVALGLVLVVTMTLSDLMNNAATAAVMCPIALGTANQLSVNPDAFLMAVAVGASCAFLTPIGHQNNTLILGPGGFRFGDYWRLGLPLEILVITVSIPMLILVWPL